MSQAKFEKLLHEDALAGRVIKLAAVFESRLDYLLTEFFGVPEPRFVLYTHLISKLSLHQKTELLKNTDLGGSTRSRNNFIASLLSLRKLRNALAHSYHLGEAEVSRLYSDLRIRKMVLGYPRSLSDEKRNLEVRFSKLWNQMYASNDT